MRQPSVLSVIEILRRIDTDYIEIDGKIVPARSVPNGNGNRIKIALMVFRGQADAILWPGGQ